MTIKKKKAVPAKNSPAKPKKTPAASKKKASAKKPAAKKSPIATLKAQLAKKVASRKKEKNNVKLTPIRDLLKCFTTSYNAVPKDGPVYVRLPEAKLPAVTNYYGNIVAEARTSKQTLLCLKRIQDQSYHKNAYLTYTTPAGRVENHYFMRDHQVEHIDRKHPDYAEVNAIFDEARLRTLYNELEHDFEIGSDPEIFVENKDGRMIPAFLFLQGKDGKDRTPNWDDVFNDHGDCPMYWDGFQAEFTTRPDHCLGYHSDSIAAGMRGVYDAARRRFPDARLSLRSVFFIEPEMLANAEDEHVNFGCMPSINAYGLKVKMPPPRQVPFRSAGGHIHFGVGKEAHKDAEKIVKALDAIIGVACVSLFDGIDDPSRRQLYGLPGEYRLPAHGIEYRPLSNAWLCHPMIMNLVIDVARKCVVFGQRDFMKFWKTTEEETIECIINCDAEKAREILTRNKDVFLQILRACYRTDDYDDDKSTKQIKKEMDILFDIFMGGIATAVKDPNDFVTNWRLHTGWSWHSRNHSVEPNVANFLRAREKDPSHLAT